MERERKGKNVVIFGLLIAVVSLSVAFAVTLTQRLDIKGTAELPSTQWSVHFNDPVATASSTLTATELKKTSGTLIEFAVALEEGKTFEFEAPVQNDGSVNAKLDTLTLSGASDKAELVTFEVASDSELKENGLINADETKKIKIRVSMGTVNDDNVNLADGSTLNLAVVTNFVSAE